MLMPAALALLALQAARPRDPAVKAGKHRTPVCEHGAWTFAGSDTQRQASK
jgi:hypothetical protein